MHRTRFVCAERAVAVILAVYRNGGGILPRRLPLGTCRLRLPAAARPAQLEIGHNPLQFQGEIAELSHALADCCAPLADSCEIFAICSVLAVICSVVLDCCAAAVAICVTMS